MDGIFLGAVLMLASSGIPRVGVVVTGEGAGDLQRQIETRLVSVPGVQAVSSEQLAESLGSPPAGPHVNADAVRHARAALDDAQKAYYLGEYDRAARAVDVATRIQQTQVWVPREQQVRAACWQAVLALAREQPERAREHIRDALALEPELQLDLRQFPPSLSRLLAAQRSRMQWHVLTVEHPAGARVWVDGRRISSAQARLPAGRHRVWAAAPGRRALGERLELTSDATWTARLPLRLEDATDSQLVALTRQYTHELAPQLRELGEDEDIDAWLIVTIIDETAFSALVCQHGVERAREPSSMSDRRVAHLVRWAAQRLAHEQTLERPYRVYTTVSASTQFALRNRTVSDAEYDGYTMRFTGTGPSLAVRARMQRVVGVAEASWTYYGFHTATANLPDGSLDTVDGGFTLATRAAVGYRQPLGSRRGAQGPSVALLAGGSFAHHHADVFTDDFNRPVGLLTSHQRTSGDLRLRAEAPFRAGRLSVIPSAELTVSPWVRWRERSEVSLGSNPTAAPSTRLRAGLGLASRPWSLQLALSHERTQVRFQGEPVREALPFASGSRLENAVLQEHDTVLTLVGQWQF